MTSVSIPLLDSHLHLQDAAFDNDREAVLQRARRGGVGVFVCNATCEDDWSRVADLADRHADIIPCFGVHPWWADRCRDGWLDRLAEQLDARPSVIGEIGLDRWIEPRDEQLQEQVFIAQLDLACRRNLPVMVHCLKAWGWLIDVLNRHSRFMPPACASHADRRDDNVRQSCPTTTSDTDLQQSGHTARHAVPDAGMLIHAYGGSVEMIEQLVPFNAYFSFAGNILEPRRSRHRQALQAVPTDRLLTETDAPDMPPPDEYGPYNQRSHTADGTIRNEPANLAAIVPALAELRGMDETTFRGQVWANARRLFDRWWPDTNPAQPVYSADT